MSSGAAKLAVVMGLEQQGPVCGATIEDIMVALGLGGLSCTQVKRAILALHFRYGVVDFVRPRIGGSGSERLGEVRLLIRR